jgi:hypothetical protein
MGPHEVERGVVVELTVEAIDVTVVEDSGIELGHPL